LNSKGQVTVPGWVAGQVQIAWGWRGQRHRQRRGFADRARSRRRVPRWRGCWVWMAWLSRWLRARATAESDRAAVAD